MRDRKLIIILSFILILLSAIACCVNLYVYKYPGNNYFPPNIINLFLILLLIYLGCALLYGKKGAPLAYIIELARLCAIFSIIAFATSAVQYSPFKPIDSYIVQFEHLFKVDLVKIMASLHNYAFINYILKISYDSLTYQMVLLPIMAITFKKTKALDEYYIFLLLTLLIGFTIYYFLPTTAPASILNSPFFSEYQKATGIKFTQIHNYINPTTMEGGLIALPSFHVIWACLCLQLARNWLIIYMILLPINITLIFACVILGWHYPTDVLASSIVLLLAYGFFVMYRSTAKRRESSCKNHAAIKQISISNNTFF